MRLENLRVYHWSLAAATLRGEGEVYANVGADLVPGSFFLATCQRKLWVTSARSLLGAEELRGAEGYRFLLRVATGLESQVRGETDIFGQFKEAWKAFEGLPSRELPLIKTWITRLFEDTKEIRSLYLQNTGGDSYGSLVRKILRKYPAHQTGREIDEPILLVGAGLLAQSVAPWLAQQEIWLINRSVDAAQALAQELTTRHGARVRILSTEQEQEEGWIKAAHAVLCIPADAQKDPTRVALWKQGSLAASHARALVHLGGIAAQIGEWAKVEHAFWLDDVFALQREQNEAREDLFLRAERACDQKARLRSLTGSSRASEGSASLPHGWEDLAIFA